MRRLRILFVSAEYAPLAKVGGLADMTAGLSLYLAGRGHDVRILLPDYGGELDRKSDTERWEVGEFELPIRGETRTLSFWQEGSLIGRPVLYRLFSRELYGAPDVYTNFAEDGWRFVALNAAAPELMQALAWTPDIVHCHDWQAALVPVLLGQTDSASAPKSVLTLHNLGYQGVYPRSLLDDSGLNDLDGLYEHDGDRREVNLLASGIGMTDSLTTVSPTYAREIQTAEYGMGLHELLHSVSGKLTGILNGVDYTAWDPGTDARIFARYTAEDLSGKRTNKDSLCHAVGIDAAGDQPLVGFVSRLVAHKGVDLILSALPTLLEQRPFSCVILGDGDEHYVDALDELASRFPGRFAFVKAFDETLAHRIMAGSDIFMVPSIYEPCGLTQMYALRYAAVPVVRKTGGLADTIRHFDPQSGQGNGCVFEHADVGGLTWGLGQALDWVAEPALLATLRRNGMAADFSWTRQGPDYEALYESLL